MIKLLDPYDYASMGALVALTCTVGFVQVYRTRNASESKVYSVVSRDLSTFSLIMSIVAILATVGTISGHSMEVYSYGLVYALLALGHLLATVVSAHLFLPVFYQLDKHTVFEYLELRFCKQVRTGISVIQTIKMILMCSFYIYATSLLINQVTTFNIWACVWLLGGFCIIYTALGGFKAVVWSNVAQQIIFVAILIILIVKGFIDLGGPEVVWNNLVTSQRNNIFRWTPGSDTQYTFWTFAVGSPIYLITLYSLNQPLMQRSLSSKNVSQAKFCLICGGIGYVIFHCLVSTSCAIVAARYYNCDPQVMGHVNTRDQMIILFAAETLSFCKGLTGVFMAALLGATISALSANYNSLAAVTMGDYVRPFYPQLTPIVSIRLSKLLTVIHGLLSIVMVYVIQHLGGIMRILFIVTGMTGGPTLVIFTVGMLFPRVNTKAAIIGTLASVVLPWWVILGNLISSRSPPHLPFIVSGCSNQTDVIYDASDTGLLTQFYAMSPVWFVSWCLAVGLPVSLIAGKIIGFQDASSVDANLLFPFVQKFNKISPVENKTEPKLNETYTTHM